jgi:hypothetical protein
LIKKDVQKELLWLCQGFIKIAEIQDFQKVQGHLSIAEEHGIELGQIRYLSYIIIF